jgi:hypothetical protein
MSATMHISGLEQILADRGGTKDGLLIFSGDALLQKVVAWSVPFQALLRQYLTYTQVRSQLFYDLGPPPSLPSNQQRTMHGPPPRFCLALHSSITLPNLTP